MKRIFNFNRDIHRRVAASYILAFGVIAICLVTMFLTVHWMLEDQQNSVKLVDKSGRQRMLSQRIAMASEQLVNAEDSYVAASARGMLSETRNAFAGNCVFFSNREQDNAIPAELSKELDEVFAGPDGLDQLSRQFIARIDQLLEMTPGDPKRADLSQQIFELANNSLLIKLDAVTDQIERHSSHQIIKTRQIQSLLFLVTLIVLVFEAVFIFQPILHANERIDFAANHDPLTQLPNRRMLSLAASAALEESRKNKTAIGFMHLDLDCFKSVNDTLGHSAGDEVLRSVAATLRNNLRPEQLIARIGGDEFAVLFTDVRDIDELVGPANRLIEKLRRPISYEDKNCIVGCSIGLAISRSEESDFERVLMDADIALYEAKNNGRNQCQMITEQLRGRFDRKEQVAKDIREGIDRNEFVPFFQPQFDSETGQVTGVEALARWIKPNGVFEKNAEFIPIADDIGLLAEIDQQILFQSLAAFVQWRNEGFSIPRLSLNFSVKELEEPTFVSELTSTVVSFGLTAADISIEILESVFFDNNNETVVTNINALSKTGFTVELDDFGTGHAAVTSLLDLAIDRIKLDRSLIRDIENGGAGQTITRTLITLAQELDIDTLAEGVETERQVEILCQMGCTNHQGYFYAKPMSRRTISRWLANRGNNVETTSEGTAGVHSVDQTVSEKGI